MSIHTIELVIGGALFLATAALAWMAFDAGRYGVACLFLVAVVASLYLLVSADEALQVDLDAKEGMRADQQ